MANKKVKTKTKKKKSGYTASDIQILSGLEPVRKRPGMYIGSTGPEGVFHLLKEIFGNAIDEAIMERCDQINISLLPGNRVEIKDNGQGIPVDIHPKTKKSALETIMTYLHAGAKFGGKVYAATGGLHGVGISVVSALSKYMKVEVCRNGQIYSQEYSKGKPTTKLKKLGKCKQSGTTIIFEPDPQVFKKIEWNSKKILNYLRQQAYLTKGVKIVFWDKTSKKNSVNSGPYTFYFEGGIMSYIRHLVRGRTLRHPNIFYAQDKKDDVIVEAALVYTKEFESFEGTFANNVDTSEGGMHLTGFRMALTRTINEFAKKEGLLKDKDNGLAGKDAREGLTSIISVKVKEPQFEGQTKRKLGNPEARTAVAEMISEHFLDFLERNPSDARAIIESALLAQKAREAAKSARETVVRKGILRSLALPGKLADCSSRKPEKSEIFIVEGQSAGGCWSGDTNVALADGRNLSFKKLVKEDKQGKKNFCYTICDNGHIGIAPILNPRVTKKNAEVIKIVLDNGEGLVCTPEHLFRLVDGSYIPAIQLTSRHNLAPFYRKMSKRQGKYGLDGYEMIFDPRAKKWMYTHILADIYNLRNKIYIASAGKHRHHVDFNKQNNDPTNIQRLSYKQHMGCHYEYIEHTLRRPDVIKRSIETRRTDAFREKIRKIMTTPEMRKMLSERAKEQWENEKYKKYMIRKFLEFYRKNKEYREKNNKLLYENQKKYWSNPENREKWASRMREYYKKYPEKKEKLSEMAKKQWQDEKLLEWRRQKTKEQWTPEFRVRRKRAYNQTYQERSLRLMREIFEKYGEFDKGKYTKERLRRNDKTLLKHETICQRFFENNEKKLKEAILNYNHKIKKIIKLKDKIDVYDLEVKDTHNFALASGVFVHNSARQARDRHFQAILPLRGKILNVEKARLHRILSSKEIKALIIALGTAIAEDFDISKLRYHRIILTLDADIDGAHIKTLLLTLFYRYLKPLIENGYVYVAQPPLYKIQSGKNVEYVYTEQEKDKAIKKLGKRKSIDIQRYKGLGEMNADELWSTTMNPENRVLLKIGIEDAAEADRIFDTLMGEEVLPRKKFIQAYARKVKNLDI